MNRKQLIYIGLILIMTVIVSASYFSYAFFTHRDEQHGKLNIVAGKLNYKIEAEELVDNEIYVPEISVTVVNLKITSLNDIDTKYVLSYDVYGQDITVYYDRETQGDEVSGIIRAHETVDARVIIENTDENWDDYLTFFVNGGFVDKDINTISITGAKIEDGWDIYPLSNLIFAAYPKNQITTMPSGSALSSYLDESYQDDNLYASNDTNSGTPTYFFRGPIEDNYVVFASKIWRIVRINEDGTFRLILDDSIDSNNYVYSNNALNYDFTSSNAYSTLLNWYNSNIANNPYAVKLMAEKNNYFCNLNQVAESSGLTTDQISGNMIVAANYYPTFTCSDSYEMQGAGLVNTNVGLLTYDEAIFAGYMPQWNGLNSYFFDSYLLKSYPVWTMSPAGANASDHKLYNWILNSKVTLNSDVVEKDSARLRPVINLRSDVYASKDSRGYYVVY